MESRELQEIKARAEQVKKLLGRGSDTLHLIEDDFPRLVAEVERLRTELERSGLCPHERPYKDRTCVECFGDGTEEMRECSACGAKTWHRGGKCLRHDASVPKPYEPLKDELKKLQGEIQTVQEQSSTRVAQAEERVREIEAEAEQLREELERSGLCPHERPYEDRTCVEGFGDGTEAMRECGACGSKTWHRGGKCLRHDASVPKPYEPLKEELKKLQGEIQTVQEQSSTRVAQAEERVREIEAEAEQLREELERSGLCPHERPYEDRTCVECFGDGTEEMRECGACGIKTWHRGGKCLRHDASVPKPYEPLKEELKQLQGEIQTVQEQSSTRVTQAEERVKEIEAACVAMREALEYVKGRIGSMNIGESLIKIDRALSSSTGDRAMEDEKGTK